MTLELYRIGYPEHRPLYSIAWDWMREQPDLYNKIIGFEDFSAFAKHQVEQIDFALRNDDQLIAFASLLLKQGKTCEFELITPPRPRVRSVLALCDELQRQYFEDLGFEAVYAEYPDDPRWDRPRRLCRMFGWREPRPNYFEYTINDHLSRFDNGQEQTASLAARAV